MDNNAFRVMWGSRLVELVPDTFLHVKGWLEPELASQFQTKLEEEIQPLSVGQRVFGPRGSWFNQRKRMVRHGDSNVTYTYKDKPKPVLPWTSVLQDIRTLVENVCGCDFNCVVSNFYLDGSANLYPHTDITYIPQLGQEPDIVSVSFGATRDFMLVKQDKTQRIIVPISHGDLFIMTGRSQLDWKHGLPSTDDLVGPRISLTFRKHIIP